MKTPATVSALPHGIYAITTEVGVYVRLVGRGTSRNSECLRSYLRAHLPPKSPMVSVDLQLCDGMDSTFLGALAGIALSFDGSGMLRLWSVADDCRRTLTELGVVQISSVQISSLGPEEPGYPALGDFELLPGSDIRRHAATVDPVEQALLILECHECLCRANDKNEARFREVKEFLREDIARRGGISPPTH